MTVLGVIQAASLKIGVARPSQVFASTDRTSLELRETVNEAAQQIAQHHDWSSLKTLGTLTGDGTITEFPLAALSGYGRMLKKAQLWPSGSPFAPLHHIADSDQWLGLSTQNYSSLIGSWTILGDEIAIRPALADGSTVQFYHISSNLVRAADASLKPLFTADDDTFRLDERVLKLGVIWNWKSGHGQPYAADLEEYETALAKAVGNDKGSNILVVGRRRWPMGTMPAFPGTIEP